MLGKLLFHILFAIISFCTIIILIILILTKLYLLSSIESEVEISKKDFIEQIIKDDKWKKQQLLHTYNFSTKEINQLLLTLQNQYQKEINKFNTYCKEDNSICKINYDTSLSNGTSVKITYTFDKESMIFFNDGQNVKCKIHGNKQCSTYKLIYQTSYCYNGDFSCYESGRTDYSSTTISNNKISTNIKIEPFVKETLGNIFIKEAINLISIQEIQDISPFEKQIIKYIQRSKR